MLRCAYGVVINEKNDIFSIEILLIFEINCQQVLLLLNWILSTW